MVPPFYTAVNTTNNTFLLQLPVVDQSAAELLCNKQCGHLAAFVSRQEQNEVETWYTSNVSACRFVKLDALLMGQAVRIVGCWSCSVALESAS